MTSDNCMSKQPMNIIYTKHLFSKGRQCDARPINIHAYSLAPYCNPRPSQIVMWPIPDVKSGENLMHIPKCKAKKAFKSPAQPPMGLNLRVPQKPNDSIL